MIAHRGRRRAQEKGSPVATRDFDLPSLTTSNERATAMSVARTIRERNTGANNAQTNPANPTQLRLVHQDADAAPTPPQWLLDIPEHTRAHLTDEECRQPEPPDWWLELPETTRQYCREGTLEQAKQRTERQWTRDLPRVVRDLFTDEELRRPEPPDWWLELPASTREEMRTLWPGAVRRREAREAARDAGDDARWTPVVNTALGIDVAGQRWQLWLGRDLYLCGDPADGLCDGDRRQIVISNHTPSADKRLATFWHELGHAAGFAFGALVTDRVNHEQLADIFSLAMQGIDAATLERVHRFLLADLDAATVAN